MRGPAQVGVLNRLPIANIPLFHDTGQSFCIKLLTISGGPNRGAFLQGPGIPTERGHLKYLCPVGMGPGFWAYFYYTYNL